MLSVNELRQGVIFEHDGKIYQVEAFDRHKMGRGQGVVNVTARELKTQSLRELTFKSGDTFTEADVNSQKLRFVYSDERRQKAIFTDPETEKRQELDQSVIGTDNIRYLTEGIEISALIDADHQILSITLPKKVELKVTDAPPNEKGNTASGGTKPVTTETGLTVQTPFFIATGDTIVVNTESGEYVERVSS